MILERVAFLLRLSIFVTQNVYLKSYYSFTFEKWKTDRWNTMISAFFLDFSEPR